MYREWDQLGKSCYVMNVIKEYKFAMAVENSALVLNWKIEFYICNEIFSFFYCILSATEFDIFVLFRT